jgi:hypothetical protein
MPLALADPHAVSPSMVSLAALAMSVPRNRWGEATMMQESNRAGAAAEARASTAPVPTFGGAGVP